jgi:DNA-binding transcriptional ArsR family regulator
MEEPSPPTSDGSVGRPKGYDPKIRNEIIRALTERPMRFSELQQKTGIHRTILSKHLDVLEKEGAVKREILKVKGHYVQYSLVGPPLTVREFMLSWERGRVGKFLIPYERYIMPTAEELKALEFRAKENHRLAELVPFKEFGNVLKPFFKEDKYEWKHPETEKAFREAMEFYKKRVEAIPLKEDALEILRMSRTIADTRIASLIAHLFIEDYNEERFCFDCFEKGSFVLLIPDHESGIKSCLKCGYTTEIAPSKIIEYKDEESRREIVEPVKYGKLELGSHPEDEKRFLEWLKRKQLETSGEK